MKKKIPIEVLKKYGDIEKIIVGDNENYYKLDVSINKTDTFEDIMEQEYGVTFVDCTPEDEDGSSN